MFTEEELSSFKDRLHILLLEHRDLDDVITNLSAKKDVDQLLLRRLKKRKLHLKDSITLIESKLIPDINA